MPALANISDLAVAPNGVRMVRVDRRSGKRVFDAWPSDEPLADVIWEAFKPDTEPPRRTRQDEIAARREEIIALLRRSRLESGLSQGRFGQEEQFVEEQGGIY